MLKTEDLNPFEPDIMENKFYAQGIGYIKAVQVKGGSGEKHLVQIKGKIGNDADLKAPANETQLQRELQKEGLEYLRTIPYCSSACRDTFHIAFIFD